MNKDVFIAIRGIQMEAVEVEEKNEEPIEIICPATYFFKNGLHYVFYEEVQEGTTSLVQNKIVFKENEYLEVIKKGGANSIMRFSIGEEYITSYATPYGDIELGVTTEDLSSVVEQDEIGIEAFYDLAVNGEHLSNCKIFIKISDKNKGIFL